MVAGFYALSLLRLPSGVNNLILSSQSERESKSYYVNVLSKWEWKLTFFSLSVGWMDDELKEKCMNLKKIIERIFWKGDTCLNKQAGVNIFVSCLKGCIRRCGFECEAKCFNLFKVNFHFHKKSTKALQILHSNKLTMEKWPNFRETKTHTWKSNFEMN